MRFLLMLSLLSVVHTGWAQETTTDGEWLARRGVAEVDAAELNQYLLTVPEEHRAGVMSSRKRVGEILNGLLLNEQMVHDALNAGLDKDPIVQVELERAHQRVLIQAWLQRLGDSKAQGDVEQLAYEQYLTSKSQFTAPESVDVTHLLVSTKERPDADAKKMTEDLYAQITSGSLDFDTAVTQYSEDPSKANNHGSFTNVRHGQMVKPFEDAVFTMREPGSFSSVVHTDFGYHIIRLDAYHSERQLQFDEVKGKLIEQARTKLAADVRSAYQGELEAIEPTVNEAAIQAVMEDYRPMGR